jgi:hypothetical protein
MRNSVAVFRFGVSFPILVKSTLLHEKARSLTWEQVVPAPNKALKYPTI